jgi:hypothetical protein
MVFGITLTTLGVGSILIGLVSLFASKSEDEAAGFTLFLFLTLGVVAVLGGAREIDESVANRPASVRGD